MANQQINLVAAVRPILNSVFEELRQHCAQLGIKERDGWKDTLEPVYDELFDNYDGGLRRLTPTRYACLDALHEIFYSNTADGRIGLLNLLERLEDFDVALVILRANVAKACPRRSAKQLKRKVA
jgi:hypothetical protein